MIDLEHAADQLIESLGERRPDPNRVRAAVRHRQQRRRRRTLTAAVLVALAMGAGALGLADRDARDREQVRTGPVPQATPRWADHSGVRIVVPDGWAVVTGRSAPARACQAEGLVLIGYGTPAPDACPRLPSVELSGGGGAGGGSINGGGARPLEPAQTRQFNGYDAYLDERTDLEMWSVPKLDATITGRHGADLEPILSSIGPSARWVAFDDVATASRPDAPPTPAGWRSIRVGDVVVQAPPAWRRASSPGDPTRRTPPCDQWHDEGPTIRTDQVGGTHCEPLRSWEPADGLWIFPLDATDVQTYVRDLYLTNANGIRVRLLWSLDPTVLQVVVPAAGDRPATLIRIGLGPDGHVAGSVINSIDVVEG